jgi:NADH pyrophosphatase NudC (nudix superfamily)
MACAVTLQVIVTSKFDNRCGEQTAAALFSASAACGQCKTSTFPAALHRAHLLNIQVKAGAAGC